MMGAGKSTVGPALAERLGRDFVDLDAEIERMAGSRIVEIFEDEGEVGFRRRESEAISAWANRAVVVALGGGAIAQEGAARTLNESGVVVYLRGRVATLVERLGDCEQRPLLRDLSPRERTAKVSELLKARKDAYESARLVVDVDEQDPESIADLACAAILEATS
jgi:shikimate kinase